MTKNKLNRTPDDPMWSGRLVQGTDGGWEYSDCTLDHLASHLKKALNLVEYLSIKGWERTDDHEGHGVLSSEALSALAQLHETVDSLQRTLPWIDAWCVGFKMPAGKDGTPEHYEVITAHRSVGEANPWATEAQHRYPDKSLMIFKHPVPILQIIHPDATPDRWDHLVIGY